ncbi:hypothetical protein MYAM1_000975 [Malassezia yamatoensis]|uniref:Major facilitator superfamily (MFS) profile domain-containing protein n=1 Tax=Malassezia yamatoensis TaxID=253288 RepID=A0AAJ5YQH3_9BASI|nr:hypothetical protein MYAM1_000975 [Malassezia yamatoensis]
MVLQEPPIAMDTLAAHVPEDAARETEPSANYITSELGVSPQSIALMRTGMERSGWTLWMLTVCAGLSGSLFGYDTGYISSVLVSVGSDLGHPLSDWQKEMATSATSLGALIGSLCAGFPSDWFGRKVVIAIANVVFIIGAVIQAASHTIGTLIAGRLVVGIGVGVASMIVPVWIGELAPTHLRGRLVTLNVAFLTLGQVIANGVGAGFSNVKGGWRYTVAGGAIPAIVSLISMSWLPESPRFDGRRGRVDKVAKTFQRIFPDATSEYCRMRAEEVCKMVSETTPGGEPRSSFQQRIRLLFTGPNARALAIAAGLQALQQLSGFNTLMYYCATIFESVGLKSPVAVSMVVSVTNFLGTVVAFWFIDIVGRRRAIIYTIPIMSAALVFASICFYYMVPGTPSKISPDMPINHTWADLLIVAFVIYVLFYALGLGNVPWQQGELFSIETRAMATSIATATNWGCNLLINATYLSLSDAITPSGAFGFYAGLCALGAIMCFFGFPDTRQLSLEEVHYIFRHSWGIKEADRLRKEKHDIAERVRARDFDMNNSPSEQSTLAVFTSGAPQRWQSSGQATPRPVDQLKDDDIRVDTSSLVETPDVKQYDPLDDWKDPSHESSRSFNQGSLPAARPYQVPQSAERSVSPPPVEPIRRSTSMPYIAPSSSMQGIRPPMVDPDRSNNALSRMGIRGSSLMLFVTCFASLGVFLFGYDQGVMSGILTHPAFETYFEHPTAPQIGTMVAILEIGALFTSLVSGVLADKYGRKQVLVWGAMIFSLGGAIQTFAVGYKSMVVGRIISGFGVGFLSMIVPTYQSEVSPAENRGKLACIEFTGNIIGYMGSVWFDYLCSFLTGNAAWRAPLFLQPVIGLILAFGSVLLPESPRWLLDMDRSEEAMQVLTDLHNSDDPRNVRAKLEFWEIRQSVMQMRQEGDRSYSAMWHRLRKRTLIGMSSQMFAQLNGINVISYYAPLVFESAGWVGRNALLMTGINAIIYVLSTIPSWFLVDSWGRRPILLSGALLCALTLGLCGMFLRAEMSYTPQAVVMCVVLFNASFGFSWGPIPWAWTPEIMPLAFRAKGTSLSAATNWLFNWIVGQLTPVLQESIQWRLYILHACFCLCSFVMVYYCYPETQGVPLEEMDAIFGDAVAPVPQHMGDENDDEFATPNNSDPEVHRVRRSISTHPRFLESVERKPKIPEVVSQLWDAVARHSSDRGQYERLEEHP